MKIVLDFIHDSLPRGGWKTIARTGLKPTAG
jgi:hypothetical protein